MIHNWRIGTNPPGSGLRVAVTRRPPRGVPKSEWASLFDVWFPLLAPSDELLRFAHEGGLDPKRWKTFEARYRRELEATAETRGALDLLAAVGAREDLWIGCFCDDESLCHRSILSDVLRSRVAQAV